MADIVRALLENNGKVVYPINDIDSVMGLRDSLNESNMLDFDNPIVLNSFDDFHPSVNPKLWTPGRHVVLGSDIYPSVSDSDMEKLPNMQGNKAIFSPYMPLLETASLLPEDDIRDHWEEETFERAFTSSALLEILVFNSATTPTMRRLRRFIVEYQKIEYYEVKDLKYSYVNTETFLNASIERRDPAIHRHSGMEIDLRTINLDRIVPSNTANRVLAVQTANQSPAYAQVSSAMIANNAVTATQIADSSVATAKVVNGAITAAKIANSTITATQIANAAITSAKIANNAVTATQIADGTVTAAKIANATITGTKIANNTVTATQIADSTITAAKIANNTITGAKIADNAITAAKIANVGAIDADVVIGSGAKGGTSSNTVVSIGRDVEASGMTSVAIGWGALASSNNSVSLGAKASNASTATQGIAIGSNAKNANTNSIALGAESSTNATGAVAIGNRASSTHTQAAIIAPNNSATTRATNGSNRVLLGYTGITPAGFAAFSNVSDKRDKRDVGPLEYDALEFINAIEPVQYRMDFRSDYVRYEEVADGDFEGLDSYCKLHEIEEEDVFGYEGTDIEWLAGDKCSSGKGKYATKFLGKYRKNEADAAKAYKKTKAFRSLPNDDANDCPEQIVLKRKAKFRRVCVEPDGSKAGKRYHNGFLAQQVQETALRMGFDCPAVEHLAHNKDEDGVPLGDDLYSLKYTELIAPMVAAIQRLTARNAELEARLAALEQTNKS